MWKQYLRAENFLRLEILFPRLKNIIRTEHYNWKLANSTRQLQGKRGWKKLLQRELEIERVGVARKVFIDGSRKAGKFCQVWGSGENFGLRGQKGTRCGAAMIVPLCLLLTFHWLWDKVLPTSTTIKMPIEMIDTALGLWGSSTMARPEDPVLLLSREKAAFCPKIPSPALGPQTSNAAAKWKHFSSAPRPQLPFISSANPPKSCN